MQWQQALITAKDHCTDLVRTSGGQGLSVATGLGVALTIVNAVIATILINARFWYSSGREMKVTLAIIPTGVDPDLPHPQARP